VCRVREAKRDGMKVMDVDGSYLHRKQALSNVDDTPEVPTSIPLTVLFMLNFTPNYQRWLSPAC
jgi:hypothetical protein